MCLSGAAAMASIDPWRLCQGEIRLAFPQRTALGTGDRGRGGGGGRTGGGLCSAGWMDGRMEGGHGGKGGDDLDPCSFQNRLFFANLFPVSILSFNF